MSSRTEVATGLVWGIRASFVRYVLAQPDGRCDLRGAKLLGAEEFVFLEDKSRGHDHFFTGEVHFSAHGGALSLVVADPALERSDDVSGPPWYLTIDQSGTGRRTRLAALTGNTETPSGKLVRLTDDGAALFGGYYRAGDVLDPFVITSIALSR